MYVQWSVIVVVVVVVVSWLACVLCLHRFCILTSLCSFWLELSHFTQARREGGANAQGPGYL